MLETINLVLIREGTVLLIFLSLLLNRFQKALPSIIKFLKQVAT